MVGKIYSWILEERSVLTRLWLVMSKWVSDQGGGVKIKSGFRKAVYMVTRGAL